MANEKHAEMPVGKPLMTAGMCRIVEVEAKLHKGEHNEYHCIQIILGIASAIELLQPVLAWRNMR